MTFSPKEWSRVFEENGDDNAALKGGWAAPGKTGVMWEVERRRLEELGVVVPSWREVMGLEGEEEKDG